MPLSLAPPKTKVVAPGDYVVTFGRIRHGLLVAKVCQAGAMQYQLRLNRVAAGSDVEISPSIILTFETINFIRQKYPVAR